jgi:hypothetical protein
VVGLTGASVYQAGKSIGAIQALDDPETYLNDKIFPLK